MRAEGATIQEIRERLPRRGRRSYRVIQRMLGSRSFSVRSISGSWSEPRSPRADRRARALAARPARPRLPRAAAEVRPTPGPARGASLRGLRRADGRRHLLTTGQYAIYRCPDRPPGTASAGSRSAPRRSRRSSSTPSGARIADVEGRASQRPASARPSLRSRRPRPTSTPRSARSPASRTRPPPANASRNCARIGTPPRSASISSAVSGPQSSSAGPDWDRLSLDGRRALIRAVVDRVLVAPGRGADRVSIEFVG